MQDTAIGGQGPENPPPSAGGSGTTEGDIKKKKQIISNSNHQHREENIKGARAETESGGVGGVFVFDRHDGWGHLPGEVSFEQPLTLWWKHNNTYFVFSLRSVSKTCYLVGTQLPLPTGGFSPPYARKLCCKGPLPFEL